MMGRLKEANLAFRKSLSINSAFWIARRGLAANYLREGQVDTAAFELRKVLKDAPTDPAANFLMGQIHFILKDCRSALRRFGKAAELVKADTQVSLMEVECQIEIGQNWQPPKRGCRISQRRLRWNRDSDSR